MILKDVGTKRWWNTNVDIRTVCVWVHSNGPAAAATAAEPPVVPDRRGDQRRAYLSPSSGVRCLVDDAAARVARGVVNDAVHAAHRVVQLPAAAAARVAAHDQAVCLQGARGGREREREGEGDILQEVQERGRANYVNADVDMNSWSPFQDSRFKISLLPYLTSTMNWLTPHSLGRKPIHYFKQYSNCKSRTTLGIIELYILN